MRVISINQTAEKSICVCIIIISILPFGVSPSTSRVPSLLPDRPDRGLPPPLLILPPSLPPPFSTSALPALPYPPP